jgi:hypothetical protein
LYESGISDAPCSLLHRTSSSSSSTGHGECCLRLVAVVPLLPLSDSVRAVRLLAALPVFVHVDRHELVVVGLPLVNRLQVSSKG